MGRKVDACCFVVGLLAVAGILVMAFAVAVPVQVTVDEAYLGRLALAAPGNGTRPASLSYDLTLVVTVHNDNWAMGVRRTAPLDAELRFAARPFARFRLAGAADWDWIRRSTMKINSFSVAGKAALGRHGAAEFARERASGVFELELIVAGEFKYQAHFHSRSIRVTCPLTLSISTPTMPRVKCT